MIKNIYICDKCGFTMTKDETVELNLYDLEPFEGIGTVHLCPDCFMALFGTMKISKGRTKARKRR